MSTEHTFSYHSRTILYEHTVTVEDYQGILVHDHEKTFYHYGSDHQECLAHVQRYLKDSIQNETEKIWSRLMRSLIQEMIPYRNSLPEGADAEPATVSEFEKKYIEILQKAKVGVPTTNNEAERLLRSYKRKQQQAVSFRSQDGIDYLCRCMGMLVMMRQNDERNIFQKVSQIFRSSTPSAYLNCLKLGCEQ